MKKKIYGRVTVFLDASQIKDFMLLINTRDDYNDVINKFNPVNLMIDENPETSFWRIAISPVEDDPPVTGKPAKKLEDL